jgi:cell division septum initiation protein DivIVA
LRVALDRQSIEKTDFPVGRKGYDQQAVNAHLNALANEVDELKRTAARRESETRAASASEQVHAIVAAAETGAAEIHRQAEDEAARIRSDATREAHDARDQAREYVGKVSAWTSSMLQRLDAMEDELSALIESLRTGSQRLNADLQRLEGSLGEAASAGSLSPSPHVDVPPDQTPTEAPAHAAPTAAPSAEVSDDDEGARLIALNMALNGTPREDTERYLFENFQLSDHRGLLDQVYASVDG